MRAIDGLRERLAELTDLAGLSRLAAWDQEVMMPKGGTQARAHQLATLERHAHKLATDDQIGAWLEELESDASELNELERDIVRLARRDWERQRRVPAELVGRLARAASEGQLIGATRAKRPTSPLSRRHLRTTWSLPASTRPASPTPPGRMTHCSTTTTTGCAASGSSRCSHDLQTDSLR